MFINKAAAAFLVASFATAVVVATGCTNSDSGRTTPTNNGTTPNTPAPTDVRTGPNVPGGSTATGGSGGTNSPDNGAGGGK